jgi:hypothetical protein
MASVSSASAVPAVAEQRIARQGRAGADGGDRGQVRLRHREARVGGAGPRGEQPHGVALANGRRRNSRNGPNHRNGRNHRNRRNRPNRQSGRHAHRREPVRRAHSQAERLAAGRDNA